MNYCIIENVTLEQFLSEIIAAWPMKKSATLSIIGWHDGDHFLELCKENGGAKQRSFELFAEMPIGKTFKDLDSLIKNIMTYGNEAFLGSENGKYRFVFDIFVWVGNKFWAYNPYLNKMINQKLGILKRLSGYVLDTPWKNVKSII